MGTYFYSASTPSKAFSHESNPIIHFLHMSPPCHHQILCVVVHRVPFKKMKNLLNQHNYGFKGLEFMSIHMGSGFDHEG